MGDADAHTPGEAAVVVRDEFAAQQAILARIGLQPGGPDGAGAGGLVSWPDDVTGAPLIIDTDIGSDPDDAMALAVAARGVDELALVTTGDETGARAGGYGQRARAARWLLDACGRPEVPVAAGAALDDIDHFVLADAVPRHIPQQDGGSDVVAAVAAVAERHAGPLRWVGIAPMTNLARVITERPDVAARLRVTQMGAAVDYRDPDRAEHNVRFDLDAAREVLAAAQQRRLMSLELVTSDVTFTEAIAVGADHPLCQRLRASPATWAQMLHLSLSRWFTHPRGYDHSMQHDALTLSASLEHPFVESVPIQVELDSIGRLVYVDHGDSGAAPVLVAQRADYPSFMQWLQHSLGTAQLPAARRGSFTWDQNEAVAYEVAMEAIHRALGALGDALEVPTVADDPVESTRLRRERRAAIDALGVDPTDTARVREITQRFNTLAARLPLPVSEFEVWLQDGT